MVHNILLVDDESIIHEALPPFFIKRGFKVESAESGKECLALLKKNPGHYSVVILDFGLSDCNGASLIAQIHKIEPLQQVLIFSGDESRETMSKCWRSGASGFFTKSESLSALIAEVERLCERHTPDHRLIENRAAENLGMVGSSPMIAEVRKRIFKLREKDGPVLILGETGTGKELAARGLHGDRSGAFMAVSCAEIGVTAGVARSELFGHTKGSFTGADRDKKGVFEAAENGTVFLDEFHCLPMEIQGALLRALQERSVTRMGSTASVAINCRLVTATKAEHVKDGALILPDLYYRISQNVVEIPALRDRKKDIAELIELFSARWRAENQVSKRIGVLAVRALERWDWPGNIRELQNEVYSTLNACEGDLVGIRHLHARMREKAGLVVKGSRATLVELRDMFETRELEHLVSEAKLCRSVCELGERLGITRQGVMHLYKRHKLDLGALLNRKEGQVG